MESDFMGQYGKPIIIIIVVLLVAYFIYGYFQGYQFNVRVGSGYYGNTPVMGGMPNMPSMPAAGMSNMPVGAQCVDAATQMRTLDEINRKLQELKNCDCGQGGQGAQPAMPMAPISAGQTYGGTYGQQRPNTVEAMGSAAFY